MATARASNPDKSKVSDKDTKGYRPPHPCDRCCRYDIPVEAVVYCEDCKEYMCASCCDDHQQETVRLAEEKAKQAKKSSAFYNEGHFEANRKEMNRTSQSSNTRSAQDEGRRTDRQEKGVSYHPSLANAKETNKHSNHVIQNCYVGNVETERVKNVCNRLLQQFLEIKSVRKRQRLELEKQWEDVIKKIHDKRIEIVLLLDNLEAEVKSQVESIHDKESEFLSEHVRTGESAGLILEYVLERLDAALQKGTPEDILKATRFANSMAKKYTALLASMDNTVTETKIDFQQSDEIKTVLQSLTSFGEITLSRTNGRPIHTGSGDASVKGQAERVIPQPSENYNKISDSHNIIPSATVATSKAPKPLSQRSLDTMESEIKLLIEEHKRLRAEKKRERAAYIAGENAEIQTQDNSLDSRMVDYNNSPSPRANTDIVHRQPVVIPSASSGEFENGTYPKTEVDQAYNRSDILKTAKYKHDALDRMRRNEEDIESARILSESPSLRSPRAVSQSPRMTSNRSRSPVLQSPRLTSPRSASPRLSSERSTSPRVTSSRPMSPKQSLQRIASPISVSSRPLSPSALSHRPVSPRPSIDKQASPRVNSPKPNLQRSAPSQTTCSRSISASMTQQPLSPNFSSPKLSSPRTQSPKSSISRTPSSRSSKSKGSLSKKLTFDDDADDDEVAVPEPITAVQADAEDDKGSNPDIVTQYRRRFEDMIRDMSSTMSPTRPTTATSSEGNYTKERESWKNQRPISPRRQKRAVKDTDHFIDGYRAGSPIQMSKSGKSVEKTHPLDLRSEPITKEERKDEIRSPSRHKDGKESQKIFVNCDDPKGFIERWSRSKKPGDKNETNYEIIAVRLENRKYYESIENEPNSSGITSERGRSSRLDKSPTTSERGRSSRLDKSPNRSPRERRTGTPTVRFDFERNTYHESSDSAEENKSEDARNQVGRKAERFDQDHVAEPTNDKYVHSAGRSLKESQKNNSVNKIPISVTGGKDQNMVILNGQGHRGLMDSTGAGDSHLIGVINVRNPSEMYPGFISGVARCEKGYVLADWNTSSLILVNADFRPNAELCLASSPWKVTSIGDGEDADEIAVTLPLTWQIQFFRVTKDRLVAEHTLSTSSSCRDIVYSQGELIVSTSDPYTVQIMSIEGNIKRTLQYDSSGYDLFESSIRLAVGDRGAVIYVSEFCAGLTALSRHGEILFAYAREDVKSSTGVAVDKHGDLYVASVGNNSVVKLSKDGKKIADFISGDIHKPECVFYCSATGRLVITTSLSNSVRVYSLH